MEKYADLIRNKQKARVNGRKIFDTTLSRELFECNHSGYIKHNEISFSVSKENNRASVKNFYMRYCTPKFLKDY